MALKLNTSRVRKTAHNKIGNVDVEYTYEHDQDGKVMMMQVSSNPVDGMRLSFHYDPTNNGIHISLGNMSDNFNPSLLVDIFKDIKQILNTKHTTE